MTEPHSFHSQRRRIVLGGVGGVIVIVLLIFAFIPEPIAVDTAVIERGEMLVTVSDEGETRVRDVYTLSTAVSGRVLRITAEVGDPVTAYKTVVARIEPTSPNFLDMRTRMQAESAIKAAEAAQSLAEADVARAQAELDYARAELERAERLARKGNISASALDRARLELKTREAALATAQAALKVKQFELEQARAALIAPDTMDSADASAGTSHRETCCIPIYAPINGNILRIFDKSERVVGAGTPLVEIGDPHNLEIVVDLLSTDAVKVREGADVIIDHWGGEPPLRGRVRRVEPFGFTKVSALGIEEQRVNVIVDLIDPPELWRSLGHGFRVEAHIVTWRAAAVLKAPLGALFREGEEWAVFRVEGRRARLNRVEIGHTNDREAEILSGLEEGDVVILHPGDQIEDGVRIAPRPAP